MSEQQLLDTAAERIERYRKADATITVTDQAGHPVPGASVRVEQTRHAFLFGCNAFPVLGWEDPKQEATYEQAFTDLFNYATLGFYWSSYEREPGHTSEARLRRQAVWCRDHGIATKGHPLVWHETYPAWGPSEVGETKEKLHARVTHIVSGFAGLIDRWDVVNEATSSPNFDNGVGHWAKAEGPVKMVREALSWARKANPKAILLYNDYDVDASCQELVADLLRADPKCFDVMGIQSHMHQGEWPLTRVWEVCEAFARFGKPIHFTETTVLSGEHGWERPKPWPTTPEGERQQAEYVAKLYTVLFSNPAVEAITWWDLEDGSWQGAPAGLLRADLTPKPAYSRLLQLIKGAWWTKEEAKTDASGRAHFRGFLGHYHLTVGTTTTGFDLTRGNGNTICVTVG